MFQLAIFIPPVIGNGLRAKSASYTSNQSADHEDASVNHTFGNLENARPVMGRKKEKRRNQIFTSGMNFHSVQVRHPFCKLYSNGTPDSSFPTGSNRVNRVPLFPSPRVLKTIVRKF